MEFAIAAIIFVALLACWFVLPAIPTTTAAHVVEPEGTLAVAQPNAS